MSQRATTDRADRRTIVEGCVDSVEAALLADAAGADRIELCAELGAGGTTPSLASVVACVERVVVPVHVMIRPRGGGFVYDASERTRMRRDIEAARAAGAAAVVLGVLDARGRVDVVRTRELVESARPLPVTFHRAFDGVPDAGEALEALLEAGVARVLTSGGAARAEAGLARLAMLVGGAGSAIEVMAGGGVRAPNVKRIVQATGVRAVHARCDPAEGDAFTELVAEVDSIPGRGVVS